MKSLCDDHDDVNCLSCGPYWLNDEMFDSMNVDLNCMNYCLFHVVLYYLCAFIVERFKETCESYGAEVIADKWYNVEAIFGKCLWRRGHCFQVLWCQGHFR